MLVFASCVEDVRLGGECPGPDCMSMPPALDASTTPLVDAGRCSASDASCACVIAAPVLAHWPLDESSGDVARDIVAGHNGMLQGSETSTWVAGTVDGALQFDGMSESVVVGAIPGTLQAVSLWLQANSTEQTSVVTAMQPASAHGPLDGWQNPELAYVEDNRVASTATFFGVVQQHWGGFHLSDMLPRGAMVKGITVAVDTANLGLLGELKMELSWDGGTSHTNSNYRFGQLIFGTNSSPAGGSDKNWGHTWTDTEFTDANFRVRASFNAIANAMGIDFIGVQLTYAQQAVPRAILGLTADAYLTFAGNTVQSVGWQATSYVNGAINGALRSGWNHVAVVGSNALAVTDMRLGAAHLASLNAPFDGVLDDVRLFSAALSPAEIQALSRSSACAP